MSRRHSKACKFADRLFGCQVPSGVRCGSRWLMRYWSHKKARQAGLGIPYSGKFVCMLLKMTTKCQRCHLYLEI